MRFMQLNSLTVLAGALLVSACAGGEANPAGDTAGATTAMAPGAAQPNAPGGAVTAQAATGQTHTVRMLGDAQGYRYEPVNLTIKQGDAVKFVMVSGGPHNVDFDENAIPAAAVNQLAANMTQNQGGLTSPMMINANEDYTVSFAGVPAGTYPYVCVPHLAMNMKGTIVVQ